MSGDLRITAEEGRLWQRSYVGAVEGMKRLSRVGSELDGLGGLHRWLLSAGCWALNSLVSEDPSLQALSSKIDQKVVVDQAACRAQLRILVAKAEAYRIGELKPSEERIESDGDGKGGRGVCRPSKPTERTKER